MSIELNEIEVGDLMMASKEKAKMFLDFSKRYTPDDVMHQYWRERFHENFEIYKKLRWAYLYKFNISII